MAIALEIRYSSLAAFLGAVSENDEPGRALYVDTFTLRGGPTTHDSRYIVCGFADHVPGGQIIAHRFQHCCGAVILGDSDPSVKDSERIANEVKERGFMYRWKVRQAFILFPGERPGHA